MSHEVLGALCAAGLPLLLRHSVDDSSSSVISPAIAALHSLLVPTWEEVRGLLSYFINQVGGRTGQCGANDVLLNFLNSFSLVRGSWVRCLAVIAEPVCLSRALGKRGGREGRRGDREKKRKILRSWTETLYW